MKKATNEEVLKALKSKNATVMVVNGDEVLKQLIDEYESKVEANKSKSDKKLEIINELDCNISTLVDEIVSDRMGGNWQVGENSSFDKAIIRVIKTIQSHMLHPELLDMNKIYSG